MLLLMLFVNVKTYFKNLVRSYFEYDGNVKHLKYQRLLPCKSATTPCYNLLYNYIIIARYTYLIAKTYCNAGFYVKYLVFMS